MVCRNPESIEDTDPVAVIAEQLWRKAGCPRGRDLEFWALAEQTYWSMRRLAEAIARAEAEGRPFPAPSPRTIRERPDLVAELLTRAVLLDERCTCHEADWSLWQDVGGEGGGA